MQPRKLKTLIKRYLNGKATSAERYMVEHWLELFQQDRSEEDLGNFKDVSAFKAKVFNRVLGEKNNAHLRSRLWIKWAAAALFICVLSVSLLFYIKEYRKSQGQSFYADGQTISTDIRQVKNLLLPDSSIVYVNSNSRLKIVFSDSGRLVELDGEAYFDVKQDALRPFIVQTRSLKVKVLGTSFNVKAYQSLEDIQVAVSRGKVQVTDGRKIMALSENEGLNYDIQNNHFRLMEIHPDMASTWKDGVTVLDGESFESLSLVIYNQYGFRLKTSDKEVRTTEYTITVRSTNTLEQTMKQLSEALKKKYRKEGNSIIIY